MSTTHTPVEVSDDKVAADLRHLTEVLVTRGHGEHHGGLLGGQWGYGTEFSNDVFEMHPFYWGDCVCGFDEAEFAWSEANDHTDACYQQVIRERGFLDSDAADERGMPYRQRTAHNDAITSQVCAEMGLDPRIGSYVHCTCDYHDRHRSWCETHAHDPACGMVRPNFRHKPTGTEVRFYKYLGRSMEIDLAEGADWHAIVTECLSSVACE